MSILSVIRIVLAGRSAGRGDLWGVGKRLTVQGGLRRKGRSIIHTKAKSALPSNAAPRPPSRMPISEPNNEPRPDMLTSREDKTEDVNSQQRHQALLGRIGQPHKER